MIAIYARQSAERENSVSIKTQIDFCMAMVRPDEKNLKLKIYIDQGCSGGNINRPDFQKLLSDIIRGRIKKVITYKLDRISRSLNDFVNILQVFRENGVEFISSQEAFDTSSVYGDLILKILIVFAEFERTAIINRITDAYHSRSEMGFYMGGRRPYGFDLEEASINNKKTKKFIAIPQEIAQIEYIYHTYSQENITLRRLMSSLIENGIKPVSGSDWTTSKISTILKNPIYVKSDADIYDYFQKRGVRIINKIEEFDSSRGAQLYGRTKHEVDLEDWSDMKLILLSHDGVINSNIWLKCQRKLEENKQIGNAASNKTSWLAGKIVCSGCGHTMTTIKSKSDKNKNYRRYFNCTGKSNKKNCHGINVPVYTEDLESMIYTSIADKLCRFKSASDNKAYKNNNEKNSLKIKLKEIEETENKLIDSMLSGNFNDELIEIANAKAAKMKKNKEYLFSKINELKEIENNTNTPLDLTFAWKKADFEEKRGVARILIYKIIISQDGSCEIIWNI